MLRALVRGLHALPPERAHALALGALRLSPRIYDAERIGAPATVMGLSFPNRIGLAGGFDKDGDHINQLAKLGFGFIEVGTITPRPQSGSPQPRLFRLPAAQALINRMGFNSRGVEHAARRLAQQGGGFSGILGCNIGCNRDTDKAVAYKDYLHCLRRLYGLANYYVLNISSPNTPGLRNMQKPVALNALLRALVDLRDELSVQHREKTPLLIKIDPEQSAEQIEAMAGIVRNNRLDGIVATNTTTQRSRAIAELDYGAQPGGLSGLPLREQATEAIRTWRRFLPPRYAIIGVGGIMSRQDAQDKLDAGADLVQVYTGLIYKGPRLVADCAQARKQDSPAESNS